MDIYPLSAKKLEYVGIIFLYFKISSLWSSKIVESCKLPLAINIEKGILLKSVIIDNLKHFLFLKNLLRLILPFPNLFWIKDESIIIPLIFLIFCKYEFKILLYASIKILLLTNLLKW